MYDIAIIGGGVGGLVTASGCAQFGAKTVLVEKEKLGGDCLNYGCVPTKTLLHTAKIFHTIKDTGDLGINVDSASLDFKKVMDHMRQVQSKIAVHDDPERFRKMGVEILFGSGSFKDRHTFNVNGTEIKSRNFLVATGSRPAAPPIPGLENVDYLTNETILELEELPKKLLVIGAGPIGMEYAQCFSRFGSRVTVIEKMGQILPREESELADILEKELKNEGIEIETCIEMEKIEKTAQGIEITALCEKDKCRKKFVGDKLMVAIGRAPNVEGLNLEGIGVAVERSGIKVNGSLRTGVPNIFACGDVTGLFPFTHMAEHEAGIVVGNAIFPFVNRKMNKNVVPWATFTDPELARVGMTEAEAKTKHGQSGVKIYKYGYSEHDRAIIEGKGVGEVKLVCNLKGGILGAHILGQDAGNLIHEYALAMNNGISVQKISSTIHVYPTMGQIVKRAADQYYREKLFSGPMATFSRYWFGRK
ncbi:MAG: mercuric reductase [bacterium]|nr:MAG: mercuric reductase [bacterium]